jgi:hypothetical protein
MSLNKNSRVITQGIERREPGDARAVGLAMTILKSRS